MKNPIIAFFILLIINNISGLSTGTNINKQDPGTQKFEMILPDLYRYKGASNSYLIKSGSSAILIDAGSENIGTHLKETGVSKIDWVLHTHYHRDQGLADQKLKQTGTTIAIGEAEKEMLHPAGNKPPFNIPDKFLLNGEVPDWGRRMAPVEKPGVEKTFVNGETFDWKQYRIHVLYTPGHTEGSVSYTVEIDGKIICFTGDLILKGGYAHDLYSMQWTYLENPGIDSSLISLDKIRQLGSELLLPSHGDIIDEPETDMRILSIRLQKVQKALSFERAGRWNWSGFVPVSPHVIQDCATTSQIIIAPEGEALMFDCGDDFTIDRLEKAKKMFGIKRIAIIIPSHWHYDHIDGIQTIADAEKAKVWVWEGLAEHLEFPERFPTTCWAGKSIKPDRILLKGEEFLWGGYSFKVYPNPAHMEEQMALSAIVDGLKYFLIADGTSSNKESHIRSAIHGYNGISLATGLIKTAQSFYDADPYLCLPAHSNGFATHDDTKDEFMNWAVETTDVIKALLPPAHPEIGFNPYWATFYPAKIKSNSGEKVQMSLRLSNFSTILISGKFRLKSYGNISLDNDVHEFAIEAGEIKDFPFTVKCAISASPGIHIITADILYDNEVFAEFPQGYVVLERDK
jgi:glyoxylase-like metal-dependent hydrolase (beta-lactamase superfamily II)